MKSAALSVATVFLALSACAAYELQPLSMNHPANPQAMIAPEDSPSKTLAYSRSDMPASSCCGKAATGSTKVIIRRVKLAGRRPSLERGKLSRLFQAANQLVVEHGEIKGFMEPMTMGYRIEPASLLEGLQIRRPGSLHDRRFKEDDRQD